MLFVLFTVITMTITTMFLINKGTANSVLLPVPVLPLDLLRVVVSCSKPVDVLGNGWLAASAKDAELLGLRFWAFVSVFKSKS